jgi:serine phosphatase RsbU (regulator of sigma subunit)/tetratricopeptide (TPR) repeat protein
MFSQNPALILFKTFRFFLFLILLFSFGNDIYSQNNNDENHLIDSLSGIIIHPRNDIKTASAYVGLSEILYVSNIDTVIPLCTKAVEIADVIFKYSLIKTKSEKKALLKVKANALNNIGYVYDNRGNISKALEYYLKGLKIREEIDDESGTAESLNNVGAIYRNQGNNEKALDYYNQGLTIGKKIGDKNGIANVLSNIGGVYNQQGDWSKALEYYSQSLTIYKETGDKKGIAELLSNIGTIYANFDSTDMALEYYNKSLKIREEIEDKDGITISLYTIAKIEFDKNRMLNAKKSALRSLELSKEIGFPARVMNAADLLYKIYINQNEWKNAFDMYELYIQMRDSISNEEIRKDALKRQLQYEYDKKESEIKAEQDKQAAVAAEKNRRQQLFLWLIAAVALAVAVFAIIIYRSLRVTRKQKTVIEIQKTKVENQKHLIEIKQKEILDSIRYAKYLQDAILPPQKLLVQYLSDFFIFYKPKDIVAGDFYWIEVLGVGSQQNKANNEQEKVSMQIDDNQLPTVFIAVADCTGHGVPGAMVSVVCSNALNRAVKEFGITEPGKILNKVRELVIETFEKSESRIKDGMDIALITLNLQTFELQFSGANNPLYIVHSDELIELKGDRMPVAIFEKMSDFTNHKFQLQKGDLICAFTDGLPDQFGGPNGKKFMYKQLKEILRSNAHLPMNEQKQQLYETFSNWKGEVDQIDDITVIGIRV